MARIDTGQLDDFNQDFVPNRVDGSIAVWDGVEERFKPLTYLELYNLVVKDNENVDEDYKKIFLLMGA